MGETILKITLAELSTVRLRCECGAVVEMNVDLVASFDDAQCPHCEKRFVAAGRGTERFGQLASALEAIRADEKKKRYTVEFPIVLRD
jgi:hypothetical protein